LLRFEQLEDRTAPASYFTLQNPGPLFTQEGEVVSLHLNEYLQYTQPPPETAGSIAFTASGLPPGLTLDALSGVITGSPDYSIAHPDQPSVDFTITLTASDGTESDSVTFTWTILDAPDAANNPSGPPDSPPQMAPYFPAAIRTRILPRRKPAAPVPATTNLVFRTAVLTTLPLSRKIPQAPRKTVLPTEAAHLPTIPIMARTFRTTRGFN
jgi:hypothetical protein